MWHLKKSNLQDAKMDIDSATNAVKTEHVQIVETDDSDRIEFIEIVPVIRHTDGSYTSTTECVKGDRSAENHKIKQENLAVVKLEPHYVCVVLLLLLQIFSSR